MHHTGGGIISKVQRKAQRPQSPRHTDIVSGPGQCPMGQTKLDIAHYSDRLAL